MPNCCDVIAATGAGGSCCAGASLRGPGLFRGPAAAWRCPRGTGCDAAGVCGAAAKGRQLRADTVLAAWLLKVTALECRNALKAKNRRVRRGTAGCADDDSEVGTQQAASGGDEVNWDDLSPHLDAALDELSDGDREAVVMRYFLNRSYEESAASWAQAKVRCGSARLSGAGKNSRISRKPRRHCDRSRAFRSVLAHAGRYLPLAGVGTATVAAVGKAALTKAAISKGVFTIMSASSPAKIGVAVLLVLAAELDGVFIKWTRGSGHAGGQNAATTQATSVPVALPAAPQVAMADQQLPARSCREARSTSTRAAAAQIV